MKIEQVGELSRHSEIEEWLESKPVEIPFLGSKLSFILEGIEDDPNPSEFVEAIKKFLALTDADRQTTTPFVFKNYTDFVDAVDDEDVYVQVEDCAAVWKYVHMSAIHVSRRPHGDKNVHVLIAGECDWEIEHGIQVVFREGNVLRRVSAQDGHLAHCDAYAVPENEDRIC